MPANDFIVDPAELDLTRIVADIDEIRRWIPQRDAMEQLTAIVLDDLERHICVGYRDLTENEFWVSGHMPGFPLMPGVLMCEAAAQLCSYFCYVIRLIEDGFIGFGGMEDVRFRGQVRSGDRLLIVAQAQRVHRRQTIFETQGFVETNMVFHGRIIGVPLSSRSEKVL